jgi:allophanate hydrolase
VIETAAQILSAYRAGAATPEDIVSRSYRRIRAHNDPAIFITLRDEAEVLAEAKALNTRSRDGLPLYGIPVAIKDNIDVEGLPTTAACPAFSYRPARDATAVARLRKAGAIVLGKTNLDQFATGLVGTRTPYGIGRNLFDDKLIPGGSSTGSALAVATGIVPLSLATDTAGSGRIPAGFCNIVGLKPSRGLIPISGVFPACRTLDCVSVFALTVDDAASVLKIVAGPDSADPFSRPWSPLTAETMPQELRFGVPLPHQRSFFGDHTYAALYEQTLVRLEATGAKIIEIDFESFFAAARLLYDGPWVAERYLAVKKLIESAPEALHPVTRQIILSGSRGTMADVFAAMYRLEELRRASEQVMQGVDVLVVPTSPTIYTIAQVLADPIQLNSRLGTYTNFVNLLDLCALAVPAALSATGLPFGITFLAPAGGDMLLASIGRAFHAASGLPFGALIADVPSTAIAQTALAENRA